MVGSNLKYIWFVGNGLTHSELPVLSKAEFWVASTEPTFPGEATLADLPKGTTLPKKSKHLIYLAANGKSRCLRRPGELCSSELMSSLSSWLEGQAIAARTYTGAGWHKVGRINKAQAKHNTGKGRGHTTQREQEHLHLKTIIYCSHLSTTLTVKTRSWGLIYNANFSLHFKRCY